MGESNGEEAPLISNRSTLMSYEDNATNLEHAVNDVYDAIFEDEEDIDEDAQWLREQRELNKMTYWLKRPSIWMILVPLFFLAAAITGAEATRKIITLKLACNSLSMHSNEHLCNQTESLILVSKLYQVTGFVNGILHILSLTKIGPISDKYGRKICLMATVGTLFVARLYKYYIMSRFDFLRFQLMVFSEVIGSLGGGPLVLIALVNCYITDVVEAHERIYSLGLNLAAFFIGGAFGPLAANFLLARSNKELSTNPESVASVGQNAVTIHSYEYAPLKLEVLFLLVVFLFLTFVLPESRCEKARKKSRHGSLTLLSSSISDLNNETTSVLTHIRDTVFFWRQFNLLLDSVNRKATFEQLKRTKMIVCLLGLILCIITSFGVSFGEVMTFYGIYRYKLDATDLGHLIAFSCTSRAVVLIILSPILSHTLFHKYFGFKVLKTQLDMIDFSMAALGVACEIISMFGLAWAPSTAVFFVFICVGSFVGLVGPCLNSAIIKFFPESKTGEVFGAMAVVNNALSIFMPVILLGLFNFGLSTINIPGIPFILAGIMFVSSLLVLVLAKYLLGLTSETNVVTLSRNLSFSTNSAKAAGPLTEDSFLNEAPNIQKNIISELHRKNSVTQKSRDGTF